METIRFDNFDLLIEPTGRSFRAKVLESPAGQAEVIFLRPFTNLELENFYLRIGKPRQLGRKIDSFEMETVKKFGGKLFDTVFTDEVFACLRTSLAETKRQGLGLRVRLRINAPRLLDLPWEFLYNRKDNRFLSLSVDTPILRYVDIPTTEPSLSINLPLRILTMISCPSDYHQLDAELEWQKLSTTLDKLIKSGQVILDRLEEATLWSLKRKLRLSNYHIFHYIGHGGFDEKTQEGFLIFEKDDRRGIPTSSTYLGTILHNHKSLRLAVLNSCEGARTSSIDPFAGVSMNLVQQGIPAVIGMQFEISDSAAITFSEELYSALADGYPVDAALVEARTAIFAHGNDIEWGTPVLFTRSVDTQIFTIDQVREQENSTQKGNSEEINEEEVSHGSTIYSKLHGTVCVETIGGVATPLLWEGESLPALAKQVFSTATDNQSQVEIHLTFGGNKLSKDNISIGRFLLKGIPLATKGKPEVEISFFIDENLQLSVVAIDKVGGFSQNMKGVDLQDIEAPKIIDPILRSNSPKTDNGYDPSFPDFFTSLFGVGNQPTGKVPSSFTMKNDFEQILPISLEEAALGKEKTIEVIDEISCGSCKGSGVDVTNGGNRCNSCKGLGFTRVKKSIVLRIPRGIESGRKIRLKGYGRSEIKTGRKGNLYLNVFVEKHFLFSREEDNLKIDYPLSEEQFVKGEKVKIPLIEGGYMEISLPYNIRDGLEICINGRGTYHLKSEGRGKLLVNFKKYNRNSVSIEVKTQIERINSWLKA